MLRLPVFLLFATIITLSGCVTPQPGDPDYDRYLQSKQDRQEWLYQGF